MKPKLFVSEILVRCLIVFAPAFFAAALCQAAAVGDLSLPRIAANTNQHEAGILSAGELTVELEIREGAFYPEDESGPSLQVFAFAERGKQLQIPGPMIRVPQDTRIHITVHNLTPAPLTLSAGVRYRLRLINILANNSIVIKAVQDGNPVEWIPIAKDGIDLPSAQSIATPASLTIAPGETYDFTFTPEKSGKIEFTYDLLLLDEHVRQVAKVTAEVQRESETKSPSP